MRGPALVGRAGAEGTEVFIGRLLYLLGLSIFDDARCQPALGPLIVLARSGRNRMLTKIATLSRRTTLLAGAGLALGAVGGRVFGQEPASEKRIPENETYWARMGVSLQGKTALVTGSTDGLCREVARQLGALGAFVIVHGRNQERGEEVVHTIKAAGVGDARFHRADLAALAGVADLAEKI